MFGQGLCEKSRRVQMTKSSETVIVISMFLDIPVTLP